MVVLKIETVKMFADNPYKICRWMRTIIDMREVLIKLLVLKGVYGWQGLKIELEKNNLKFKTTDLIIFYSGYEISEELVDIVRELTLKLEL